MDKRPIGIFDSGLGGLTVVKEIKKALPNESIIYLGDTARVPYGTRSKEAVVKFSFQDANFLIDKRVKCIVIACNTASALAGDEIKEKIDLPVFEVITPAAMRASTLSRSGRVGVIGTWATIKSGAYQKAIVAGGRKIRVHEQACPLFVPFIEEGEIRGELIDALIHKYLLPFKDKNIDALILGCTHYPIIEKSIKKELGRNVVFVNPGKEVAMALKKFLQDRKMLTPKGAKKFERYFVTDLTDRFLMVAEMFMSERLGEGLRKVSLE
jgi:glutamate racemase